MSEWLSASELARNLGCSSAAVYMAFQKGGRLKGGRIERQGIERRGSKYLFRHIPEETPDEGVTHAWEAESLPLTEGDQVATWPVSPGYRSKLVPKGPLKIVEEAPESAPVDSEVLLKKVISRSQLEDAPFFRFIRTDIAELRAELLERIELLDTNFRGQTQSIRQLEKHEMDIVQRIINLEQNVSLPASRIESLPASRIERVQNIADLAYLRIAELEEELAELRDELQRSNDLIQTLRTREAHVLQLLGGH